MAIQIEKLMKYFIYNMKFSKDKFYINISKDILFYSSLIKRYIYGLDNSLLKRKTLGSSIEQSKARI